MGTWELLARLEVTLRAGVLERRGQEGGAAERMQMGGGRVKPGH